MLVMCLIFLGNFIGKRKIGWLVVCLFVELERYLVNSSKKSLKSFLVPPLFAAQINFPFESVFYIYGILCKLCGSLVSNLSRGLHACSAVRAVKFLFFRQYNSHHNVTFHRKHVLMDQECFCL